jgi:UDPglucose--hexose-1-phosphate uridylyltransferase
MPELRKDPITGRWVIISTERRGARRLPRQSTSEPIDDMVRPSCEGQGGVHAARGAVMRRNGGAANGPGGDVRVVPNKFPALQVEGGSDRHGEGSCSTR